MQAVVLKCPPRAQFHLGKIALDVDTSLNETEVILHSDTLFSAIIVTLENVFPGEANDFVKYFDDGKIRISSAFHCFENGKDDYLWFLPKPLQVNSLADGKNVGNDDRKLLGRVKFISKKVWEDGLQPSEWKAKDCLILQNEFVLHKDELPDLKRDEIQKLEVYQTHSLPKVAVHKVSKEDGIYFQTNVQFAVNDDVPGAPKIHYFFLLDTPGLPDEARTKLEGVLHLLADAGIGGERSVGCGRLQGIEFQPFNLDVQPNRNFASLSLINPTPAEMTMLKKWQLVTRGGRKTEKDGKLKRVKMLCEGSMLSSEPDGRIVSIGVGKAVYLRSGKAFSLPVHPNYAA